MKVTVTLPVKGTYYYKAAELIKKNSLSSGLPIRLEHQPDNPYDKNAVAVRVKSSGAMLGHLSKEVARKYSALLDTGKIVESSIANFTHQQGSYIKIDIRVVYNQEDRQLDEKHSSLFWKTSCSMPFESGVYTIRNIKSDRQYIGSSQNIKDRIRSHIRDLSNGCHSNHVLQRDFSNLGLNYFEAKVLASGVAQSHLAKVEADCISKFLNAGIALYNNTIDGQGIGRDSRARSKHETVSDLFARERADDELRRINKINAEKRRQILTTFNMKRAALLPRTSFWGYFVAMFIMSFIALIFINNNINGFSLFVLSAIFAFVSALFVHGNFVKKSERSVQYQELVRQRDEELASLDNEKNQG